MEERHAQLDQVSLEGLVALIQQAVQPLNENINLLRVNFANLVTNLMEKDDEQQYEIDRLKRGSEERGKTLDQINERLTTIESTLMNLTSSIPAVGELKALRAEIEKRDTALDKRLKEFEKHLPFIRGVRWVAVVLAGLVITTIWALITGVQNLVNVTP
jgi:DNA repair exonuclease SbcCD ATPase subunit